MSEFYITLQSDSSSEILSENKISDFRNYLSSPITLNSNKYEVGMVECSYPQATNTIPIETKLFKMYLESPVGSDGQKYSFTADTALHNISDLLKAMNLHPESNQFVNFQLQSGYVNCKIHLPNNHRLKLYIPEKISNQLGFDLGTKLFETEKGNRYRGIEVTSSSLEGHDSVTRAEFVPHFNVGNTRLFVYCDIVESSHIGNTLAPILRTFVNQSETKQEAILTSSFRQILYYPVTVQSFDNIRILIRTETGDPPSFMYGTFSCTLHFRPHSY